MSNLYEDAEEAYDKSLEIQVYWKSPIKQCIEKHHSYKLWITRNKIKSQKGFCYMWYWERRRLISRLFICVFIYNCPEQHEPSQAVWHLLTLPTIKRFCSDYPAMRGAFNPAQHRRCLTVTFFPFLFLSKGETKVPPRVRFKKRAAASALSQTLPLCCPSPLPASAAFARLRVCRGIAGTRGLMGKCISHFVPLCTTLLCSKHPLFEIIVCPAWYRDVFHPAIWRHDAVTSPVNSYYHH